MNKVILGIFIFQFIAPVLICADEITSVSQKSFINEENILFWDCRNQNLQKEKRNASARFNGASRYGKYYELDPGDGSVHFELEDGRMSRLGEEWFMELVLVPSENDGNVFSFKELSMVQKGKNLIIHDLNYENFKTIKVNNLSEPLHLLIKFSKSRISFFQDGELSGEVNSSEWNLNFTKNKSQKVYFGGNWHGKIFYIQIDSSLKGVETAIKRGGKHWHFDLRPEQTFELQGTLVELTKIPNLGTIAPYRRAIIYNHYELEESSQKLLGARHIAVAHWCILDNKYVVNVPKEIGSKYQLFVEPILDNPQIKRERHFNDLSRFDLRLFYDVSYPKIK